MTYRYLFILLILISCSRDEPDNQPVKTSYLELALVQGGDFVMGCSAEECKYKAELPAHQVTVSDYYISRYEVTQQEWTDIMGENPSYFDDDASLPVERVSWEDIVGTEGESEVIKGITYYSNGFIYRLNKMTNKQYRLPTEAEWEYAARGGNKNRGCIYSGSNVIDSVAWYWNNSGDRTHPVGRKSANELGLYDMSGNVWEWCSDYYGAYSSSPQTDPQGVVSGSCYVIRGGSWVITSDYARVSFRTDYYSWPSRRQNYLGFRLAMSK
ncbi:MAG: formylglycine-generating enzyme family protein [Tannerella sp.]|jgi:formylglycine-generating enzyme required for sulfatase activity|nr:formylglycine-generating enzyme family protein [Tannerella sp.]